MARQISQAAPPRLPQRNHGRWKPSAASMATPLYLRERHRCYVNQREGDKRFDRIRSRLAEIRIDTEEIFPDGPVAEELCCIIERAMACLPIKHRFVVEHIFGLNGHNALSFTEIARVMGLSKSRPRQKLDSALRRMYQRLKHERIAEEYQK